MLRENAHSQARLAENQTLQLRLCFLVYLRDRSSMCWFTPLMSPVARPGQSQELNSVPVSMWVSGTQLLDPSPAASGTQSKKVNRELQPGVSPGTAGPAWARCLPPELSFTLK